MCLNARSTIPGHASDKPMDCPKIDILSDLNQGVGELLDCPGCVWKPSNALIRDVPEVLDGVQVRRRCWPVNCINALILCKLLAHSCHMRSGFVGNQEKPRIDCTSAGLNNRYNDHISVPCTCRNTTILKAHAAPYVLLGKSLPRPLLTHH